MKGFASNDLVLSWYSAKCLYSQINLELLEERIFLFILGRDFFLVFQALGAKGVFAAWMNSSNSRKNMM